MRHKLGTQGSISRGPTSAQTEQIGSRLAIGYVHVTEVSMLIRSFKNLCS